MAKKLLGFFSALALFPHGDGKIAFYNYHTGKVLEEKTTELKKIDQFFHSRLEGAVKPIDPKLIDLLDNIQDHFHADVIELISGYRSPTLNANLRREGYEVAEASQHIEGKAADIHIDEVTEEGLTAYVKSLKVGGVGYYPKNDFVHVDVAEVRYWELPDSPSRPFIALREGAVWQIVTDRNIYLQNEPIQWMLTNLTRTTKTLTVCPALSKFRRGKWQKSTPLACKPGEWKAGETKTFMWQPDLKIPFGKFRLELPPLPHFEHLQVRSNEFYRKRF